MKKLFISISLLLAVAYVSAAYVPTAGVKYSLFGTLTFLNVGAVGTGTQPSVLTPSSSPSQAFEFIPVSGKANTYYLKNNDGNYLNETGGWTTIFETAVNGLHSEWVIVGDVVDNIRLVSNSTSKHLTAGNYPGNPTALWVDASATLRSGQFTLKTPFSTPFVPSAGVKYNIVQNKSNLNVGAVATQPTLLTPSSSPSQAFEFIPVSGKLDTYYLKNGDNNYLNCHTNKYDVVYAATTNALYSEWEIVGANANNVLLLQTITLAYLGTPNATLYSNAGVGNNIAAFTLTVVSGTTGIDSDLSRKLVATVNGQTINVNGSNTGDLIKVYNVSGSLIKQLIANPITTSINLNSGIYLIKVNATVLKVVL
jgi:hypothetical protein